MTNQSIMLSGKEYQSVNSLYGIAIGAAFNIQNIGPNKAKFHIGDTKPAFDTLNFRSFSPSDNVLLHVPAGEKEVFILGNSMINAELEV